MQEFTLISLELRRFIVYFKSISQGQKMDFKKPRQHLVLAMFSCPIENTCILHHF